VATASARPSQQGLHNKWLLVGPTASSSGAASSAASDDGAAGNDRESGIGITVASSECDLDVGDDDEAAMAAALAAAAAAHVDGTGSLRLPIQFNPISRVDFVARLPIELAIQVLSNLDAAGVATASRVSRRWHYVASTQHIWRESFLREKTSTYATSGPTRPGAGLGVPTVRPDNDWRQIYRVKDELDRRWREGKARPVYLNGHLDSIYCLQFDE
jgi:F-box and WD-40 domain protein 1/11